MKAKKYLKVDDTHQIYYEHFGNAKGVNVLFLHGGPGLGFSEKDKIFFDPEKFNVVLFDQRGAGRSEPLASIEQNTIHHLIGDITRLLDYFEMKKVILFGGSWGSTLALLYAIEYPNRVEALVLRGVFTASLQSRQHFEKGGTATFFPEVWKRYTRLVPSNQRHRPTDYYFDQILSSDTEVSKKFAYELSYYGMSLSRKKVTAEEIENALANFDYYSEMIIMAYYSTNNFFIPDNYIEENLDKIGSIPVRIVHGRYDMICPPKIAVAVHEGLSNSVLYLVDAGHASREKEIKERLILELNKLVMNVSEVNIEKALTVDHSTLSTVTKLSKAYWGYSAEQIKKWDVDLTITPEYIETHEVYKLVVEKQIVGFYTYFFKDENYIKLGYLFIHPDHIRKGYGKLLMNDFWKRISQEKGKKVTLDADPNAEKFYEGLGFEVVGQLPSSIEGRFLPIMEKMI